MKGDHFSTEEVLSWCNIWDGKGVVTTIVIEDLCTPVVGVIGWKTNFRNLEPASAITNCGGRVADFGHVDNHRAIVGSSNRLIRTGTIIGLLVHFYRHGVSRIYRAKIGTGTGARNKIACKVIGCHISDRAVPRGQPHTVGALVYTINP